MDPLTHTLLGANLAASPLGNRTRLAAAALVIGANAPDIDAILYFVGDSDFALWFRRGWTHGVLALVLLPFIQTALLLLYARLRPGGAVDGRWLLALSAIGVWSHPALDWLNTYGIRLLMPFSGTWFYGDSVFIMDPWLWLILGTGWLLGRRATMTTAGLWLFFTIALAWVVGRRSAEYLPVVAVVAVILLVALVWKPRLDSRAIANVALMVACLYTGARITLSGLTASRVAAHLQAEGAVVHEVMPSPDPMNPARWTFVARTSTDYRHGRFHWLERVVHVGAERIPLPDDTPEYRKARAHPDVRGFVTWARFPAYRIERRGEQTRVILFDARRMGRGAMGERVVRVD